MPDEAKIAALAAAGFRFRAVCGTCIHFRRNEPGGVNRTWGWCSNIQPTHAKHTDGARVSVRSDGWCPSYQVEANAGADIVRAGYVQFITEDSDGK